MYYYTYVCICVIKLYLICITIHIKYSIVPSSNKIFLQNNCRVFVHYLYKNITVGKPKNIEEQSNR